MTTTINLGKVAPVVKGAWDITANYEKLDIVTYDNNHKVYLAIKDVPNGINITNNNYWEILGIQDANVVIDDTAGEGDYNKVWSADKTYQNQTELQDIRIGADGVTYDSAGTAVRSQMKADLDIITYENLNQHIHTPFIVGNNSTIGTLVANRSSLSILENGDVKIERNSTSGTSSYGLYIRIETDASVDLTNHKIYYRITGCDATHATHFAGIRFFGGYNGTPQGGFQEEYSDELSLIEKIITPNANVNQLNLVVLTGGTVNNGEYITLESLQWIDLTAIFGEGNEPSLEEFRSIYTDIPYAFRIPKYKANYNEVLYLSKNLSKNIAKEEIDSAKSGFFSLQTSITSDTDLNTLTEYGSYILFTGYTYTNAPPWFTTGAAWLFVYKNSTSNQLIQFFIKNTTGEIYYRRMSTAGGTQNWHEWIKYYIDEEILYKDLASKKISIVGDSISTYNGYVPTGYSYYYPAGDVNSVNKTWWKQVIDKCGMSLVTNASWSGSWVCYDSSVSTDSAKIAYTDARISALANVSDTPDIILVLIGTNDFIHNNGNPLGVFDANSELPEESTEITEFYPAYATMINKIRTMYPDAHVYCCTLIQRYRGTDISYPIKNGSGNSIALYNKAIIDIAEWMGCNVIRLDTVISLGQLSSLTVDGLLHPNASGMKLIANEVCRVLAEHEKNFI